MVTFVMCIGEDLEDLLQPQVLLLRLWFLEMFTTSPRNSATQCARETGASSTRVRRILKAFKWKVHIPRLLHAINDDDPDRRMQFCEWFQQMLHEDEEFLTKIVWSDEAQLCGLMGPNCVV